MDEIVVSDDASSDGTLEIIRSVTRNLVDLDVVILENPTPLGLVANFAQAMEACTGDVIFLSDQDDVWHDKKVGILLQSFESDLDLLLVHADARLDDEDGDFSGATLFEALEVAMDDISRIRRREKHSTSSCAVISRPERQWPFALPSSNRRCHFHRSGFTTNGLWSSRPRMTR